VAVFVSGATGYIGGAIVRALAASGQQVFGGVRAETTLPLGVTPFITGDLSKPGLALPPVAAVIHAAGLGHRRGVPEAVWRAANIDAAVNMARAAKAAGAEKFILVSTAHVHGRVHDGIVSDDTPASPADDYAASKLGAEKAVAAAFGPGVVCLRPVAVIGPGCPGNLQLVMKFLARGMPLPFGAIRNERSFIDVADLAALALAVLAAAAPPPVVLAAHPGRISSPDLVRALAEGMGCAARLPPFPPALLGAAARLAGRAAMWQSLAGNFAANPANALALGWAPAKTLHQSLAETGRYYITTRSPA
jgi:UDP-glucose 4-epimerase